MAAAAIFAVAWPLALPALDGGTGSQEVDSAEIIVVGDSGQGARLTADSLRDAAQAFVRNRAEFAPRSTLYLWVRSDPAQLGFVLRQLHGDHLRHPLELDGANRLVVPVDLVRTGDWELRVQGAHGVPEIQPLVLSPGSELTNRRFGDARLQCRVSIAFARLSLPKRALFGAIGPCASSRVALYAKVPQAIAAAVIERPARVLELGPGAMSIRVPLHDKSIGNEARMRVTFR